MITISLCMIVKNEEDTLARCLDSIKEVVDEIVVVDTGSTDNTLSIARKYTDRVYSFEWVDDFSAARNYAFSQAAMDYQMWLDADDVLAAEQAQKLAELKNTLSPDTDVVTMKYHTHFDENGKPVFTSTRGRLFRRERGFRWQDAVHEFVPMAGNIQHSDITVWHKKEGGGSADRNLRIYQRMIENGTAFTPRNTYYYARELMDHRMYSQAVGQFQAFLDGGGGWVEDEIAACLSMGRCYNALENKEAAISAFMRSFSYDIPRAEICCELGYINMRSGNLPLAIRWFEAAVSLPAANHIGFVQPDYSGFIPHIEMCVCYCRLGDYAAAALHNNKAAGYKPDSNIVKHNREYLERMGKALS